MAKSVFTDAYAQLVALLIEARQASGLTQTEVAARLGKPQSFVSKFERGERRLDVIEFCAVAQASERVVMASDRRGEVVARPGTVGAMANVALVGLVDGRGWLLLQERDDRAPVDPDRWCLVGGQVEPGESALAAAHRELLEETGLVVDELRPRRVADAPVRPARRGRRRAASRRRPRVTDADVRCGEGRQIVFVAPEEVLGLDLTRSTRAFVERVLAAHAT